MKFSKILKEIEDGKTVRRRIWGKNVFIFLQRRSSIKSDKVPNMISLTDMAKKHLNKLDLFYHDQVVRVSICEFFPAEADITYYIPTWQDLFADDWEIVESNEEIEENNAVKNPN